MDYDFIRQVPCLEYKVVIEEPDSNGVYSYVNMDGEAYSINHRVMHVRWDLGLIHYHV